MSNNPNNKFTGLSVFAIIAIIALILGIMFFFQGYMFLAEEVLEWDERSTHTVGLSILLLLYALLFAKTISSKPKPIGTLDKESFEYEKAKEKNRPVLILGMTAVMVFLLGLIVYNNKDVWNVPGPIGLMLVSSSCIFLIAADFFNTKSPRTRSTCF